MVRMKDEVLPRTAETQKHVARMRKTTAEMEGLSESRRSLGIKMWKEKASNPTGIDGRKQ